MADRRATTSKKKTPGRKRRVAGWLLLVIGVLIAGVWGASGRWAVVYSRSNGWVVIEDGVASLHWGEKLRPLPRWTITEHDGSWFLTLFGFGTSHLNHVDHYSLGILAFGYNSLPATGPTVRGSVQINLWPFALASLLGGGWLVWWGRRTKRRAMTGVCLKCGYDMQGLAAHGQCPECGSAHVSATPRPTRKASKPIALKRIAKIKPDVLALIHDFLSRARALDAQARQEFGLTDSLLAAVHSRVIPQIGFLSDGTEYYKHGRGVRFEKRGLLVDFDYSDGMTINTVGAWGLRDFAETSSRYPTFSEDEIKAVCEELVREGILVPDHGRFTLTKSIALADGRAIEIDQVKSQRWS